MLDVAKALQSATQLGDAIGLVAKVVSKLKADPDLAAEKLGEALDEVAKTLQVVDQAAVQFLSLGIDQGGLERNSQALLTIEGGGLSTAVERGRGHCHQIANVYDQHLDKWFARALSTDYPVIRDLFHRLGNADDDVFKALTDVAKDLEDEASEILNLVYQNQIDDARSKILAARATLRPLRQSMSKTMQDMYRLKAEFIGI